VKVKLVVTSESGPAAEFEISTPATLGRGKEVDLTFPHSQISREHCQITEESGNLFIRDLGSLNGTRVNDQPISEPTQITPGDTVSLGKLTFRIFGVRLANASSDSWEESDAFSADHLTDYDFGGGLSDILSGDSPSDPAG
jgi:pSer/pThr/pTyr-binding forkhead associated (FHA) protein